MILAGLYFGLHRRRFDFFSAAYVGCVLYFLPGFFGFSRYKSVSGWVDTDIVAEVYLAMVAVALAVLFGAIFWDQSKLGRQTPWRQSRDISFASYSVLLAVLGALSLSGLATMLLFSADAVFVSDKSQMLEGLGRSHLLFRYSAQVGFVLAITCRRWRWIAFFTALLLFDVYIGFRSALAMALAASLVIWLHKKGPIRLLVEQKKSVLAAVVAIIVVIFYKGISGHIKQGNWQYIVSNKLSSDEILRPFLEMESFAVVNNLNQIVISRYREDTLSVVDQAIAGAVPFAGLVGFGNKQFAFQQALFSEVDYGLAYSIWGQMWSSGGWPLLLIFILIFVFVIAVFNRLLFHPKAYVVAGITSLIVVWVIYIHRNNIGYQLNIERRIFLLLLLQWLVVEVRKIARSRHSFSRGNNLGGPNDPSGR